MSSSFCVPSKFIAWIEPIFYHMCSLLLSLRGNVCFCFSLTSLSLLRFHTLRPNRKGIDVPDSVRSGLDDNQPTTTEEQPQESAASAGGESENVMLSSLLEQQISKHRLSIAEFENEDPIIKEVRETYATLQFTRNKYDVRIEDGSYSVINKIKEEYSIKKKAGADDGFADEEGGEGGGKKKATKENKPHISTVGSSNRMIQLTKKLIHCCQTGEFQVGTKTEEKTIMSGVNLRLESGKMYLVLGAPGEFERVTCMNDVCLTHTPN